MDETLAALTAPFDQTRLSMTVADLTQPDMPLVYCNEAFTTLTGYGPEAALGRNCRFLQGRETDRTTVRALARAVRDGRSHHALLLNYRADGQPFWNELVVSPLAGGRFMLGMQREVGQAENGLQPKRLRFRRHGRLDVRVEGIDPGCRELLGAAPEMAARDGAGLFACVHQDEHDRLDRAIRRAAERGGRLALDLRAASPDEQERWWHLDALPDAAGSVAFTGTLVDVTPKKALTRRLELFEAVIEHTRDAILVTEARTTAPGPCIVYANESFTRHTGWAVDEVVGRSPRFLQGPETDPAARAAMREAFAGWRRVEATVRNYRRDGTPFWNWMSIVPVADATGWYTHWIAIQRDVTQEYERQDRIHFLAYHDEATRVANRAGCRRDLDTALARARQQDGRVAVLALDLDGFKAVNDTLGHGAGDAVLQEVARRLERCVRRGDRVARTGGDEFAVVLAAIRTPARAQAVARRIQRALAAPLYWRGHAVPLPASLGLAVFPDDAANAAELLTAADLALHAGKAGPGAAVVPFVPALRTAAEDATRTAEEVRRGLERAEFRVFVQPQFDLARGHAHGGECLLRWQHPGRGLVGPDAFIPVAEQRGLIVPLQSFLLDRVLGVVRGWRRDGVVTGALALNLTGSELGAPDFAARFRDRLGAAGLAVGDVTVEIVERVLLSERRDVIRNNLERLSDMGVAIELDDFGTGFASLSHLRDFPIDRIKIDRSFVAGIAEAPADAAIVRAMIDLAHNLGMQVIAEGVESAGQLDRLRRWSCDAVQGYLVARPMPIEDLPAWLAAASGENAPAPAAAVPVPS